MGCSTRNNSKNESNDMKLLFATANDHKAKEVRLMLPAHIELVTLKDIQWTEDIPEPYPTIEENAIHKARTLTHATGLSCFAEDTALEVDALQGAPGVITARYAGPQKNAQENMKKLLLELSGQVNRRAQFRACICYYRATGTKHLFEGINSGVIALDQAGSGGFGYDPIFIPDGYTLTQAELSPEEKNTFSHRVRAMKQLAAFLGL